MVVNVREEMGVTSRPKKYKGRTGIRWTEATWNPVVGCWPVSPGCAKCYAAVMASRLAKNPKVPAYVGTAEKGFWTGIVKCLDERLDAPLGWHKPSIIFVNSMSDLFHEDVPLSFIQRVFAVMREAHWHRFQVLTKRAERLSELSPELQWAPNIWMGVSIENDAFAGRADYLRGIGACVKFLSLEPLLGPVPSLSLHGIHWVIAGGESGAGARPMEACWVRDIRDRCVEARVPFFFKQWGGRTASANGHVLDGREWNEMPMAADVGEWFETTDVLSAFE